MAKAKQQTTGEIESEGQALPAEAHLELCKLEKQNLTSS